MSETDVESSGPMRMGWVDERGMYVCGGQARMKGISGYLGESRYSVIETRWRPEDRRAAWKNRDTLTICAADDDGGS